ncbi:hypothetical protein D3C81_1877890 [compost metagenome]
MDNLTFLEKEQIVDIQELFHRLEELQNKRILFTATTVRQSDVKEENIASLIRKEDFVFIDQKNDIMLFVLINLMEESARQIIANRLHLNRLTIKVHSVQNLTQLLQQGS